jgi:hypothetical protein
MKCCWNLIHDKLPILVLLWVSMDEVSPVLLPPFGGHTEHWVVWIRSWKSNYHLFAVWLLQLHILLAMMCWDLLVNSSGECSLLCTSCDLVLCFGFSEIVVFTLISPKHEFFFLNPILIWSNPPVNSLCLLSLWSWCGRMSQLLFATFRLATSDNVLSLIEEKIDCASKMCQLNMDHQQELQGWIDEGKKNIHFKV